LIRKRRDAAENGMICYIPKICIARWILSVDEKNKEPTSSLGKLSRRSFLSHMGAAGVATAATAVAPLAISPTIAGAQEKTSSEGQAIPGTVRVTLRVNERQYSVQIDPRATLLDTLRERCT
jgi:xanthine dehydrogenase YagT iron-sulfur-binding subunit